MEHIHVQYNSTISGKGALIPESQLILERIAAGETLATVRAEVLNNNLLDRQTHHTRETIWEHISRRYFANRTPDAIRTLAHMITASPSVETRSLVLLYAFAQIDRLVFDFVADCLYPLYEGGRSFVDKADVSRWLEQVSKDGHPEITDWSPQTRNKVVSNLLSIARDFGLLGGSQRKSFRRLYVPLPAFLYVLYDLHDAGLSGRQLVEADVWRVFLLDREDVLLLLGEAARKGYLTFRRSGNIYDLTLIHNTLTEAIDDFAAQVP